MVKITRIRPFSLARVFTIISFVVGLVVSVGSSYRLLSSSSSVSNFFFVVGVVTVGYIIFGFVIGLIIAIVYNLTFKLHGGIKVETEQI